MTKKKPKRRRTDWPFEYKILSVETNGLAHVLDAIFSNRKKMESTARIWPATREVEFDFHIENILDSMEVSVLNRLDARGTEYVMEPEDGWPTFRYAMEGCKRHRECILLTIEVTYSKRDWKRWRLPKKKHW